MDFLIEANIRDIKEKYYPNIDIKVIEFLNKLSPDYNPSQPERKTNYLPWLLRQYSKSDTILLDAVKGNLSAGATIKRNIIRFNNIKDELPVNERDINNFSVKGLSDLCGKYRDYTTHKEKKEIIKNQTKIVYDSEEWRIVIPLTWEASKFWGLNTKWCTSMKDDNSYFENYTKQGPLYINIDKRTNKKWQFHFETNSFYDEKDIPITVILKDISYKAPKSKDRIKTIADYCNIPKDVLDWYKKNREKCYETLIKEDPNTFECELIRREKYANFYVTKHMVVSLSDDGWGWFEDNALWMTDSDNSNPREVFSGFSNFRRIEQYKNGFSYTDDYYIVFCIEDGNTFKIRKLIVEDDSYFSKDYSIYYNSTYYKNFSNCIVYVINSDTKINNINYIDFSDKKIVVDVETLEDNNIIIRFEDGTSKSINLDNTEGTDKSIKESFWITMNKLNEIKNRNCDDRID